MNIIVVLQNMNIVVVMQQSLYQLILLHIQQQPSSEGFNRHYADEHDCHDRLIGYLLLQFLDNNSIVFWLQRNDCYITTTTIAESLCAAIALILVGLTSNIRRPKKSKRKII